MEVRIVGVPGPDSDRRRFRSEVRSRRLKSGKSVFDVASHLGWPPSRITQIEHGEAPVSEGELIELLETYGVHGQEHEEMLTLARNASERIWWADKKYLPETYIQLISAEAYATRITHFHPIFIPGLLQTSAYASAITVATTLKETPAGMAEELVEARMQRQQDILYQPQPVAICALVDETALYRRVGSATAMRQQLDHLTGFVRHEQVSLAIIPRSVGSHPGLLGAFMILEYDDPDSDPVVCFDGQLGNVVVRSQPDLADAYLKLSGELLRIGLSGDAARAAIRAAHATFE
jgi:transcriptional regulator with XRE-family HTH domain